MALIRGQGRHSSGNSTESEREALHVCMCVCVRASVRACALV